MFKAERGAEVRDLRARIADSQATLESLKATPGRAELREALRKDKARLAYLEQMPPLEAAGMCPECVSPAWHTPGVTYRLDVAWETGGPCPAWPRRATGVNAVREARRQAAQGPRRCHRHLPRRSRSPCSPRVCPSRTSSLSPRPSKPVIPVPGSAREQATAGKSGQHLRNRNRQVITPVTGDHLHITRMSTCAHSMLR